MAGPFETEAEVRALPEVRAIWDAFDANPGIGKTRGPTLQMLAQALETAGVSMGAPRSRSLRPATSTP